MNSLLKSCAVAAALLMSPAFASADSIQLGSYATGAASFGDANTAMNYAGFSATLTTPSTGTASSYTLDPTTVWATPIADSTWIGFATTAGNIGTSNPAYGYYTFTTSFTALSANPYSGILSIMADDTAEVLLNGVAIMPFGALGTDIHCAANGLSCTGPDTVSLSGVSLLSGVDANTLTFVVQQAGFGPPGGLNDPSGVDFQATLSTSSIVPEPATLILLGTGLFGFASMIFLRTRLVAAPASARL